VETRSQIASRRTHISLASPVLANEEGNEGMYEDERTFRKSLFEMFEMVKVLYEETDLRFLGESSKPPKGNGGNGDKPPKGNGGDGDKPPPSSPSSPSYSFTSTPSKTPPHSSKGHGKTPLLNIDKKL